MLKKRKKVFFIKLSLGWGKQGAYLSFLAAPKTDAFFTFFLKKCKSSFLPFLVTNFFFFLHPRKWSLGYVHLFQEPQKAMLYYLYLFL